MSLLDSKSQSLLEGDGFKLVGDPHSPIEPLGRCSALHLFPLLPSLQKVVNAFFLLPRLWALLKNSIISFFPKLSVVVSTSGNQIIMVLPASTTSLLLLLVFGKSK